MYFYVYKSTTIIYFNMTYMVYTTLMLLPTHQAGLKIKLHLHSRSTQKKVVWSES